MTRKKRKSAFTKNNSWYTEYGDTQTLAEHAKRKKERLAKDKKKARKEFFKKIFATVIIWPGFLIMTIIRKEFDHIWDYYSFSAIRKAYKKADFWEEVVNTSILYIGAILWLIVLPILIF